MDAGEWMRTPRFVNNRDIQGSLNLKGSNPSSRSNRSKRLRRIAKAPGNQFFWITYSQ
jgi:hypothetical protein